MPADAEYALPIGRDGLNLRDQPVEVPVTELVDSVNWRLDENGALTKRFGYATYGTLPANPLTQYTYAPENQTIELIFACDDGFTYSSPGDGSFTAIAGPFSTTRKPSYTVLDNVLYWTNGIDPIQSWDGATLTPLLAKDEQQSLATTGSPVNGSFLITWNGESTQSLDDIWTISLTGGPTGGTATLSFGGHTTTGIPFNADAITIQAALQATAGIAGPYLSVTGGPWPDPVVVEFVSVMGGRANTAVTGSGASLSGGSTPAVSLVHTQVGAGLTLSSTAAQVQTAMEGVFGIGTGNVTVTGGPLSSAPLVVEFTGTLGNQLQPLLTGSSTFDTGGIKVTETVKGSNEPPRGRYCTAWRNRLWIAASDTEPTRVWWSAISDATIWQTTNQVDLLGTTGRITGLIASPNIGSGFDGLDGVLVYKAKSLHRIIDDSDNIDGVVTGGANVLVDAGTGTISHTSIIPLDGRVYSICENGIYSTDGHAQQKLESARLGLFFHNSVDTATLDQAVATAYQGSYIASVPAGTTETPVTFELYTRFVAGDGTHPIMASDLPIMALSVYPQPTGDILYFCDSSVGSTQFVRVYGGGADTDSGGNPLDVQAHARSGATVFNAPSPKRMRRIQVHGRGALTIGVAADLEYGVGETNSVTMIATSAKWNAVNWNAFTWGPQGGTETDSAWYTRRGRYFQFYVAAGGQNISATRSQLGAAAVPSGGSAVYSLIARITPLEGE